MVEHHGGQHNGRDHGNSHGTDHRGHQQQKDPNSRTGLSWIFHFVDIIYVGAVYSIGQLFEQCGTDHKVFFIAAAYMGIMFTTRYQFDQYAATFSTHKTDDESQEFLRVCLMILYCMAIYSLTLNIAFKKAEEEDGAGHFGHCVRNVVYDNAFAASFLISRAAIVMMYYAKYNTKQYADNKDFWTLFLRKLIPMVIGCALMTMIFADVSPVACYSVVAFVEFASEFIGEAVVKFRDEEPPLMPDAHHLQDRLGEFFMLILGETMVGTLFVFYNEKKIKRTYGSCLAAFVLVTSIGMQFFERAQADVYSESNLYGEQYDESQDVKRLVTYVPGDTRQSLSLRGSDVGTTATTAAGAASSTSAVTTRGTSLHTMQVQAPGGNQRGLTSVDQGVRRTVVGEYNHHPLKHKMKRFYALYVGLHAICSFFMLVATTGIIEIYYELEGFNPTCESSADDYAQTHEEESHHHYFHLKAQVAGGLASVWACMLLMELLQPTYYNSLRASLFHSNLVDQAYSKFMFGLKLFVMLAHLAMMGFPGSPGEGNYFIFYNALIAASPSLCDIFKIIYEWKFNVKEARRQRALVIRESSVRGTNTIVAAAAAAAIRSAPLGYVEETSPTDVTHSPINGNNNDDNDDDDDH